METGFDHLDYMNEKLNEHWCDLERIMRKEAKLYDFFMLKHP